MIIIVITALALFAGTTWLVQEQTNTRHPVLHRRVAATGLMVCVAAVVATLVAVTF